MNYINSSCSHQFHLINLTSKEKKQNTFALISPNKIYLYKFEI